jgi:hypothetical protein
MARANTETCFRWLISISLLEPGKGKAVLRSSADQTLDTTKGRYLTFQLSDYDIARSVQAYVDSGKIS